MTDGTNDGAQGRDAGQRTILTPEESWDFLRGHEFGRLAYELDGEPNIVPLNYAVDDLAADGVQLVFRTSPGSTVHGILEDHRVAFEVDHVADEVGTSVVLRGDAVLLPAEEELRLEQVGLRAWLGQDKPVLVAIRATEVNGRRYPLQRPWKRMMR